MKPRKSWEPKYRFGGNPASFMMPSLLGTENVYRPTVKKPKTKKGKKR